MASLASSAVTEISSKYSGSLARKDRVTKELELVLTGQGGVTNTIPASALGLASIESVSNAIVPATGVIYSAGIAVVGTEEVIALNNNSTNPGDVTGVTVEITVTGTPLIQALAVDGTV